eukprot:scaffold369357_cov49-Prasinocladus_malaysianus.AAC.1
MLVAHHTCLGLQQRCKQGRDEDKLNWNVRVELQNGVLPKNQQHDISCIALKAIVVIRQLLMHVTGVYQLSSVDKASAASRGTGCYWDAWLVGGSCRAGCPPRREPSSSVFHSAVVKQDPHVKEFKDLLQMHFSLGKNLLLYILSCCNPSLLTLSTLLESIHQSHPIYFDSIQPKSM